MGTQGQLCPVNVDRVNMIHLPVTQTALRCITDSVSIVRQATDDGNHWEDMTPVDITDHRNTLWNIVYFIQNRPEIDRFRWTHVHAGGIHPSQYYLLIIMALMVVHLTSPRTVCVEIVDPGYQRLRPGIPKSYVFQVAAHEAGGISVCGLQTVARNCNLLAHIS